ncbi:hypothetical protein U1872_18210 [Sphingomonas sp. RB3P16]|uniref:hypothetical protein n=1 Tax=Parasphingomonas frigoris TaxID=3096163 RepID=UPI002FCABEF3
MMAGMGSFFGRTNPGLQGDFTGYTGQDRLGGMTGIAPSQPAPAPFVWGQRGAKLTPAQLLLQQQQAAQLSRSDYSPVSSVWQGLGRVVDNVRGAIDTRANRKEAVAQQAQQSAVAQALLDGTGGNAAISAAYTSGNPSLVGLGGKRYDTDHSKATAPHYWETNNGSLGMVGADGKPAIVYQDPTPKITTIAVDNGDQTKTLYQVGPDGRPIGAGIQGSPAMGAVPSVPAVGTVEDGHRFMGGDPSVPSNWQAVAPGGAAPSGTATFR